MKHILLALALMLSGLSLSATDTVLSQWQFSLDGKNWEPVTVPHSYNAIDGHSVSYYRGPAIYRISLNLRPDKPQFLLFEGAAQAAKVYVNGVLTVTHKGGYTPFVVPLKEGVQEGENTIDVVCDNTVDLEMIPISSDFNKNGGLHYPVRLLTYDGVYFDPQKYGPQRFHLTQNVVTDDKVKALVAAKVCNDSRKEKKVKVSWALKNAKGKAVWKRSGVIALPAGARQMLSEEIQLDKPHLWNGVKDPYLYTLEIKAGKDKISSEVGFRYFSIDRDKGFSLNGRPYPLRGVSMHQDLSGKASALTEKDIEADYAVVKELGCNFLRLAHYPHNEYAFRLCDRMGIIVQTEIPWVNICGVNATPAYFENIHTQMYEMITSLYNHPSIVFWGMWNELDNWGNKEEFQGKLDARRVVDETARLYQYAKSLDRTRYVGLTDDSIFRRDFYTELKADYYSENRYYGWYSTYGDFSGLTTAMNHIRETMGGPCNVSEYGVGVNPFCHTWKEEDIRRYKDDRRHVEEYGNLSHEAHVQQIAAMPWLNFTSLWILFDFPVADRKEGFVDSEDGVNYVENPERMYMNDKGLVTRDRKTKKDSFYLYKSWWNHDVETVYIAGRRLLKRPAGSKFTLTVYSNASRLTLLRNGVEVASQENSGEITGVIWKFPDLEMGAEPTTFRVQSDKGTVDEVSFQPIYGLGTH